MTMNVILREVFLHAKFSTGEKCTQNVFHVIFICIYTGIKYCAKNDLKNYFFLFFFFQKMRKSSTESTSRLCNKHTTYKHKLSRKRRRAKHFRASNKRQVAVVCDKNDNSIHNTCVRVCACVFARLHKTTKSRGGSPYHSARRTHLPDIFT